MAKPTEMLRAQNMRREGKSIKEITKILGVSKGSVSLWCSSITLSPEQKEVLRKRMVNLGLAGRLKGSQMQKARKLEKILGYRNEAYVELKFMTDNEMLMLGIGLYLGEGGKTGGRFRFSNSNPDIIRFIIFWLKKFFEIKRDRITLRVLINESHKSREASVVKQWSKITGIPLSQFRRTTFVKSKSKKVFENFSRHLGTIALSVTKSSELQYKVLGLCYGSFIKTLGKVYSL